MAKAPGRRRRKKIPAYAGFISYSQRGDQLEVAKALQRDLPRLGKSWFRLTEPGSRIFRDETNLAANPNLWGEIKKALTQSEYLILLASPDSARSPWVFREVEFWLRSKDIGTIILILTDGQIGRSGEDALASEEAALPKPLLGEWKETPLWIDLRPTRVPRHRLSLRHETYRGLVAQVAATLRGVSDPGELLNVERRNRRRSYLLLGMGLFLLAGLFLGVIFLDRSRLIQGSKLQAKLALQELEFGRVYSAARLAREGLPSPTRPDRPWNEAAEVALRAAMHEIGPKVVTLDLGESARLIRFHPDGRVFLTVTSGSGVRVWTPEGEPVGDLRPEGAILDALFLAAEGEASESSSVITLSSAGRVGRWSLLGDLKEAFTLKTGGSRPGAPEFDTFDLSNHGAFSAAGAGFLLSGREDYSAHYGSLSQREPLASISHAMYISTLDLSSDGSRLATGSWDGTTKMWSATGELLCTVEHKAPVESVVFSPAGESLFAVDRTGAYRLLPVESCQPMEALKFEAVRGRDLLREARFNPASDRLVALTEDRRAVIYDLDMNPLVELDRGEESAILDFDFSPDGDFLVTCSQDGQAHVWSQKGALSGTLQHESPVERCRFSPDQRHLITTTSDGEGHIWRWRRQLTFDVTHHGSRIVRLAYAPERPELLSASSDGTILILDADGGIIRRFQQEAGLRNAFWSPDGEYLATTTWKDGTWIWHRNGKLLKTLHHRESASRVGFNSDSTRVYAASEDGLTRVWDIATGRELVLDNGWLPALAVFSFESSHLVTGTDEKITLWSLGAGDMVAEVSCDGESSSFDIAADIQMVMGVSNEELEALCRLRGRRLVDIHETRGEDSASYRRWASVEGDHVRIWGEAWRSIAHIEVGATVVDVKFGAGGDALVTATESGRVALWTTGGLQVAEFQGPTSLTHVSLSADGRHLAAGSETGEIRVWGLNPLVREKLTSQADKILLGTPQ